MCTLQETICRFAELHSRLSDADGLGPASRRPAVSRPGGLPVRRFARSFVPSTSIWRIRTGRLSAPMFYRRRYWSAGLLREAPRRFPETGPAPADPRVRLPSRWRALRTARPWSSRRLSSLTAIGRRCPFRGVGSPPLGQMNFDCSSWKSVGGLSTPTCLKGRRTSQLVGTKGFYGPQRQLWEVHETLARGLVDRRRALEYFARIEPELYRFPAIDPPTFRRAVERHSSRSAPRQPSAAQDCSTRSPGFCCQVERSGVGFPPGISRHLSSGRAARTPGSPSRAGIMSV